ncbi:DNA polymerase III subunit epsilon [Candidatus Kinetoplastibacterium sorsogonicusi]|uniref:DNA polymerase III subunit epsilon n=1 Tax=Candidatus Kinetoplastidibacterium kentomonadis TaxID=1576550 RepID=A0A3S7JAH0_9PROT|nr:DNA polymerase III subunit epsilon [Candidatus Kinetoplastibacterium sorsogonicusi]AWD32677.1 DNA polymerase III subunit epsilon [Candidatus Kinetoplastibacterium sorsogonicusi]
MLRQIVLDTETTGLDPKKGHRIIEIGCVEIIDRIITGKSLHLYINPDREIDPGALSIHGLTNQFLSDKPLFHEIANDLLNFLKDAELIAHNAAFDIKFLNYELNKINLNNINSYCSKITDSLLIARRKFPGKRNSLDALCDRYNINNSHRKFHGALLDSELLAEVWLYMTRGQNSLIIEDNIPNENIFHNLQNNQEYNLPVILANDQEVNAHKKYIDELNNISGNAVWNFFKN